jgi:hypothetical protein
MDKDKEKNQEISLIGRLFSLEVLLILMGLFSLVAGIIYGKMAKILLGSSNHLRFCPAPFYPQESVAKKMKGSENCDLKYIGSVSWIRKERCIGRY